MICPRAAPVRSGVNGSSDGVSRSSHLRHRDTRRETRRSPRFGEWPVPARPKELARSLRRAGAQDFTSDSTDRSFRRPPHLALVGPWARAMRLNRPHTLRFPWAWACRDFLASRLPEGAHDAGLGPVMTGRGLDRVSGRDGAGSDPQEARTRIGLRICGVASDDEVP